MRCNLSSPLVRLLVFILAALLVGVGAWQARRAYAGLVAARARQTAMLAEVGRLEGLAAEAAKRRTRLQAEMDATKITPASARSRAQPDRGPTIAERLRKEPAFQIAYIASRRPELMAKYGALFRQLQLDSGQIAKFESVLISREEEFMDSNAAIDEQGLSTKDAQALSDEMYAKTDAEFKAGEAALLGPAGYAQAAAYERTVEVRDMVNAWAGGLVVVAEEPFTPAQGEALIQIVANASQSYRDGGAVEDINWNEAEAKARGILSDAQFDLFKNMEPPLPGGARYQMELYRLVQQAKEKDDAAASAGKASPGG